ncbi:MAG: hypothetical protein ACOY3P_15875, partial [Planctomycetota bacterium]
MRPYLWLLLGIGSLAPQAALAQRVQFATPITVPPPATSSAAAPTAVYQNPPAAWPTAPANAGPYAPSVAPPTAPYAAPGGFAPSPYGAPSPYVNPTPYAAPNPYSPPGGFAPNTYGAPGWGNPVVPPAPYATLEGQIQTPPPNWDPYATPGYQQQPLLPQDPYLQSPGDGSFTFSNMQRFIDRLHLDYVWMPGGGAEEMGVNEFDTGVTFALPFLYNSQTPILVTPGFGGHWFNGPSGPAASDVPSHVFDAYLDGAWNPQPTPWLGGELAVRVGVYSDFKKLNSDSIRYMGKGLVVLSFSPSFKIKAGIWYIDRVRVKLLPAGGIVWTPHADLKANIVFPNPKIARRLCTTGTTEWWLYGRGEYGDGSWTTETA